MRLKLHKEYKGQVIYEDQTTGWFVVYDDKGNPVARFAIECFVRQDIDVNMPILSYTTSEGLVELDLDVLEIVSRGEEKSNLICWM